jgi:hypothetical protein
MGKELPPPDDAAEDDEAVEVARIWITRQDLLVSLNVGLYPPGESSGETVAWGDILADTTKHVARAIALRYDLAPATVEREIIERCNASLGNYSKGFAGGLKDGT